VARVLLVIACLLSVQCASLSASEISSKLKALRKELRGNPRDGAYPITRELKEMWYRQKFSFEEQKISDEIIFQLIEKFPYALVDLWEPSEGKYIWNHEKFFERTAASDQIPVINMGLEHAYRYGFLTAEKVRDAVEQISKCLNGNRAGEVYRRLTTSGIFKKMPVLDQLYKKIARPTFGYGYSIEYERAFYYAARLRGGAEIIWEAYGGQDIQQKQNALLFLPVLGASGRQAAINELTSTDSLTRWGAIRGLLARGKATDEEIQIMLSHLHDWVDDDVFMRAAEANGYRGNRLITEFALKFLEKVFGIADATVTLYLADPIYPPDIRERAERIRKQREQ
jgi:hypothetical protein